MTKYVDTEYGRHVELDNFTLTPYAIDDKASQFGHAERDRYRAEVFAVAVTQKQGEQNHVPEPIVINGIPYWFRAAVVVNPGRIQPVYLDWATIYRVGDNGHTLTFGADPTDKARRAIYQIAVDLVTEHLLGDNLPETLREVQRGRVRKAEQEHERLAAKAHDAAMLVLAERQALERLT